jgi:hypothetical protein
MLYVIGSEGERGGWLELIIAQAALLYATLVG